MTVAVPQNAVKERIRGPNLAVFVKRSEGVPMEEAIRRADEAGLVIASNKRLSKALVGSDEWRGMKEAFACWGGDMTGYDKPDQKLGKTIEYVDSETGIRYVFPVPEEHVGKKNVILVAQHPDFTLETDGKTRVVQAKEVYVVSEFPVASENWYLGDPKYGIPTGKKVDGSDEAARYLWRIEKRVGLVARDYGWGGNYRRVVLLNGWPSDGLGVAVEAASGGAPKNLQVETAPQDKGIVISGVTLDEFKTLIGNAETNLADVSQMLRPEKLEAMRLLLQALEIKG
ncbi:MAG: hypothetical protein AB1295_01955 [Candidatus Micrarchaeota archaeon]